MADQDKTTLRVTMDTETAADLAHAIGGQIGDAVAAAIARAMSSGPTVTAEGARAWERDQIAIAAMQGFLASFAGAHSDPPPGKVSEYAYRVADAMLAEREKGAARG